MVEELRRLSECAVCRSPFRDPRILSCGHSFCFACLQQIAAQGPGLRCPQCRRQHPFVTVERLPQNIDMRNLVEGLERVSVCVLSSAAAESQPPVCKCNECNKRYVVDELRYCSSHAKYVCYKCVAFDHGQCNKVLATKHGVEKIEVVKQQLIDVKEALAELELGEFNEWRLGLEHHWNLHTKLRERYMAAKERLAAAQGRCSSFEKFLDDAVQNPEQAAVLAASEDLVDVSKTVDELSHDVEGIWAASESLSELATAELRCRSSLLFVSSRHCKIVDLAACCSPSHTNDMIATVRDAIRSSSIAMDVPRMLINAFNGGRTALGCVYYAWVYKDGSVSCGQNTIEGKLRDGCEFGLELKNARASRIDENEALEFLKMKACEHRDACNPSYQIALDADATFGPDWLCVYGKHGTVSVACSDIEQQSFMWTEGDTDYVMLQFCPEVDVGPLSC